METQADKVAFIVCIILIICIILILSLISIILMYLLLCRFLFEGNGCQEDFNVEQERLKNLVNLIDEFLDYGIQDRDTGKDGCTNYT